MTSMGVLRDNRAFIRTYQMQYTSPLHPHASRLDYDGHEMPTIGVAAAPDFPPPDSHVVNFLLAPDLVGNALGWFLYGLLVLQTYHYRKRSRRDHPGIRLTVWGLFVLETALTVITTRVTYNLLCNGWGDPNALMRLTRVDAFIPVTSALVSGWVQAFYAWRIYELSHHARPWNWASGVVILFMLTSSTAGFYSGLRTINFTSVSALSEIQPALMVWLIASALCDTLIASSMICILHRMRRLVATVEDFESYEGSLEGRLRSIIVMSLETCLLTTTLTVAMLILFIVIPESRLPTMMGFIVSKLYSNSFLVSLNSRKQVVSGASEQRSATFQLETFAAASSHGETTVVSSYPVTPVTVEIDVSESRGRRRRAEDEKVAL
ncbi:unnamed protein product [Peniophora sp. CBMAI 1063]|nr:unnamed protein product [Peniophora sp. CBMAI 1063]